MKFLGFSKIWDKNSLQIIFQIFFFFFLKNNLERKIYPDFGKPQKFHDFVFSSPVFGQKSFPAGKDFMKLSFHFQFGKSFEFKKVFFSFKSFSLVLWKHPR